MSRSSKLSGRLQPYLEARGSFVLPPFVRYHWVSLSARDLWEPRFLKIRAALKQMEIESVHRGLKAVSVLTVLQAELPCLSRMCVERRLGLLIDYEAPMGEVRVVIGSPTSLEAYQSALQSDDATRLAGLLGTPACCLRFAGEVYTSMGLSDLTVPLFLRGGALDEQQRCTVPQSCYEVELNPLWRCVGLYTTPMYPCRLKCKRAKHRAVRFLQLGRELGYEREMEWLVAILSWPLLWTALHGIAEMKSPVIKIIHATDVSHRKVELALEGSLFPEQGAAGLQFPFYLSKQTISHSRAYQKGVEHLEEARNSMV
ncbi:MAG TPA: hypothetical protein VKV18_04150 [Chthonomonas sp.]|uniref:hypothetical protein n=1 Tax=Chthonomonas sp. TaxID=2282153 RepID=UPI002B4AB3DE|nr:hypothetical protein [Chthonomonas sp.]HLI47867.1 hypothetical protein [Chthonomonas sp.]